MLSWTKVDKQQWKTLSNYHLLAAQKLIKYLQESFLVVLETSLTCKHQTIRIMHTMF